VPALRGCAAHILVALQQNLPHTRPARTVARDASGVEMAKKTEKIKTITNLEASDCRWPIGDPRQPGFHFCGAQQVLGRPYCIEHWPLSFIPSASGRPRQQTVSAKSFPIRQAA
jgi:hypothetical protein